MLGNYSSLKSQFYLFCKMEMLCLILFSYLTESWRNCAHWLWEPNVLLIREGKVTSRRNAMAIIQNFKRHRTKNLKQFKNARPLKKTNKPKCMYRSRQKYKGTCSPQTRFSSSSILTGSLGIRKDKVGNCLSTCDGKAPLKGKNNVLFLL